MRRGLLWLLVGLWLTSCGGGQLETDEDVKEAFQQVCDGRGAPDAAALSNAGRTHPIAEIITPKRGPSFTGRWRSDTVAETELVACVEVKERVVEECEYIGPAALPGDRGQIYTRIQYEVSIRLLSAQTAEQIAAEEFMGSAPPPCPERISMEEIGQHFGDPPDLAVENWLRQFAGPPEI